jgi:CubicO group peptidase (beta-lactamase class C family)
VTRRLGRGAVLCALLLAPSGRTSAQSRLRAAIDDLVHGEMARRRIPGLSLVVARDHRVVLSANYGVSSLESDAPVNERTSFEIASMTKQFTAAAILILADRGALALTDRVGKYFGDLPPAWESITIEQLMNHTSGLRDDWDEPDPFFTANTTADQFFGALKAAPLKFEPGTDWSYSCGPFVLGLIIERVTGKPYVQFMRETIFRPLGMSMTDVNDQVRVVSGRAAGYVLRDGEIRNGVRISAAAEARADVGIRSTARDLARWDAALDGASLLSATSRARMFTPATLVNGDPTIYGLGWFVAPFRGHTEIMHSGGFRTGFSTAIARYPDDRLTVIVLTNLQGAHAYSIARGVASLYNPDYRPIPLMPVRTDADSSRTRTAARVLAALRSGERPADLTPAANRLTSSMLVELRAELAHATAPVSVGCQSLRGREVAVFGTPIVANCFYRTGGDTSRFWTLSFTRDGRVAYVELEE